MNVDGHLEVKQLHAFFEAWFKGTLPRTPEAFARFADATVPEFHLVSPQGRILAKTTLEAMLESDHGSWRSGQHRIWISNYIEHQRAGEVTVATYEEWQEHNGKTTSRLSTVVFRASSSTPNGLIWLHVHETSLS